MLGNLGVQPIRATSAAVLVAVLATACQGAASGTKAGGTEEPVVLRLANGYSNLNYVPVLQSFVSRVEELSDGALRVQVEDEWGNYAADYEEQIVGDVANGTVDLGWVGTRIFGSLDVPGLPALTAPLLIDSYPLQDAVFGSDIPARLLAGLDEVGVVGLAVLPGSLRKPVAVAGPLLGPADWRGLTFQSFPSAEQAEAIEALGATATNLIVDALDAGLDDGSIQGFEKDLLTVQVNGMQVRAPYVTTNVNLWPQTLAVLGNPDRLEWLTDEQRGWLDTAAADARELSTGFAARDEQILGELCQAGARAAEASNADLEALRQAVEPVYATLAADPETSDVIDQIEQLKSEVPAGPALPIPAGCTGSAAPSVSTSAPTASAAFPEGIYRVDISVQFLVEHGVDQASAEDNAGLQTLTFANGSYGLETRGEQIVPACQSPYTVGDRISLLAGPGCGGSAPVGSVVMSARWELLDDQLRFLDVRSGVGEDHFTVVFWAGLPWQKIG